MTYHSPQKGYSLVETLIAVAILMLAIVGPMTIAAKSIQSARYSLQQNTAFFLAQEGISIINIMRNDAALDYYDTGADPWLWTDVATLAPCFAEAGCNIDFLDETLLDNIVDCQTEEACRLRYTTGEGRAPYNNSVGDVSPYTRTIMLSDVTEDEVMVSVTVQWDSTLLGQGRSVVLTTHLFNLYQ